MSECLFCRIVRGEIPSDKIIENNNLIAIRDISPQAPVHFLIMPRMHLDKFSDLSAEQSGLISELFLTASRIAEQFGLTDSGFRLVVNNGEQAGQTISHLHIHLLGGRPFDWPPG